MKQMKFIVCVVDRKQVYFRGRFKIDSEILKEKDVEKSLNLFIEVGKKFICKHLKDKMYPHQIHLANIDLSFEDILLFEYRIEDKFIKVLFKRVSPLGYALARFFAFV